MPLAEQASGSVALGNQLFQTMTRFSSRILRAARHIVLLGAVFCCGSLASGATIPARPNIVVILADDLGYGDLGCYNPQSKIPTPHLDALAKQGMRLTDAHAAAAICTPSRYGLLTGRYPWRPRGPGSAPGAKAPVGVTNVAPWGPPVFSADRLTVPGFLRSHGYATACIGKWHLGWEWPTRDGQPPRNGPDNRSNVDFERPIGGGPTTRGFDTYFGTDVPNYPPYSFIENDRTLGIPDVATSTEFETPGPKLAGWNQTEILTELTRRAVRYVGEAAGRGRPFFLYFPLTSPHHPVVPTAEFRGRSQAGDYGDFVVQTDWSVGQVLAALDRAGVAGDTLVIFTSDNGPEITRLNNAGTKNVMPVGAYDRVRQYGHASMGPWRGIKYAAWEGGHRVPLLARWPGRIPAGTTSTELLCLTDLLATCAALVGGELPRDAGEDSFDALPILFGGKSRRDAVVTKSDGVTLAVRRGPWVWLNAPAGDRREPDWWREMRGYEADSHPGQLYDLSRDPSQRNNQFAARPELVEELRAFLRQLEQNGRHAPAPPR